MYKSLILILIVLLSVSCKNNEADIRDERIEELEIIINQQEDEISNLEEANLVIQGRLTDLEMLYNEKFHDYDSILLDLNGLENDYTNLLSEVESFNNNYDIIYGIYKFPIVDHPIHVAFKEEMENWSGTTQEGVNICVKYALEWEAEMNKYYDLIYEELDDDRKMWLVSAQEKWEEYIKENEELLWQSFDQKHHKGSIIDNLSAGAYYDRYRDRAIYLIEVYDFLSIEY